MAIIESEVRLVGKDAGVAAMFDSIAAKIDRMAKNKKVSSPFSNLANDLTLAQTKLQALEKVGTTRATSELAKQRLMATKAALEQSRQLVAATEAPTKAMQRDLAAREAAHAKVLNMYQRQQEAATRAERAAQDQGLSLQRREAQQELLTHVIGCTTTAMERQVAVEQKAAAQAAANDRAAHQRREFIERRGVKHLAIQAAGNAFAAHSIVGGLEHAGAEGANLAHAQNAALSAGIPKPEVQGMTDQALDLSRRYKNVSQESLIELAKDARSAVVHPDEVPRIMPTLAAAKSVLDGLDKTGEAGGSLGSLVKGSEAIGAAQDPARLERLIDGFVRAIQVLGKTINPSEIYDFAKNSRIAGAHFSDRFLMTTAMSTIQELGGQTAGKAANEAVGQLSGAGLGKRTNAVRLLSQIGLLDQKDVTYNKIGEVNGVRKGVLHPVKGDSLLATDPDLFTYKILVPALEKAGIKSQDDQLAAVRMLYSGSKSAQDLIGKLITQRESYEAHAGRYGEASGIKGADQMATDPIVAWQGFTTQLSNLAGNLAEGPAKAAGPALDAIASGLGNLSSRIAQFNKDNPTFAPIAEATGAAVAAGGAGVASWYALRGTLGVFGRMAGLGGGQAAGGAAAAAEAGGIAGAAGGEAGAAVGSIGAAAAGLPIMAGLAAMGGGIYLLSHTGAKAVSSGRSQSASQKDTDHPGHVAHGRGGAPIWVADPPPAASPTVARPSPSPSSFGGPDFTIGRYDHGFSAVPTDDTPAGSFRPASRRRAMSIAESYPATPQGPALPLASVMAPPPQQVDVAVTIGDPKFDGQLRVSVEPSQWLIGKIDFLSQQFSMGPSAAIAKPSTGPSMANAGRPAGHVGRGDM